MRSVLDSRNAAAYLALLSAQTVAATWLFWFVVPIFRQVAADVSAVHDLTVVEEVAIIGGVVALQGLYWTRLYFLRVSTRIRSVFLGHVVRFASRVSFFFGGAFFSTIFFRHIPELDALPPIVEGLARVLLVMAVLFSLFCYSLELDRFGVTLEDAPQNA
jgi:hypothetical protein